MKLVPETLAWSFCGLSATLATIAIWIANWALAVKFGVTAALIALLAFIFAMVAADW